MDGFANVPALNMSLVDADGNVDYYDGMLRIIDEDKNVVREFDYHDYLDHFSEAVEKWSYMKFPFLKDLGREEGSVRVGPLGRMNVTKSLSTPLAQQALESFHAYTGGRTEQHDAAYQLGADHRNAPRRGTDRRTAARPRPAEAKTCS